MQRTFSPCVRFSLLWALVSALTWGGGMALGFLVGEPRYLTCIIGMGFVIGVGQWLCLRPYVARSSLWVVANLVGWPIIVGTSYCVVLVGGAVLSLTQWLVLQQGRSLKTLSWIPVSNVAWVAAACSGLGLCFTLSGAPWREASPMLWSFCAALSGGIYGALTGPFLRHKILGDPGSGGHPVIQSN